MSLKVGFVMLANPAESGGDRAPELLAGAVKSLEAAGVEVVAYRDLIEVPSQAIAAAEMMNEADVDSIVVMLVTWALDSLEYIFTSMVKVPATYWAIPYTETFSIGCIQHYGSVLKALGYSYQYVYGLPGDKEVADDIVTYAKVGRAVKECAKMKIALVGPRQTWRVAGPQDMSREEWDYSKKTGVTFIHLEMEDIMDRAEEYSDEEAKEALSRLLRRSGKVAASEEAMIYMAKMYLASKAVMEENHLTNIAAECYPNYGGLMNLTSSWMADEGVYVDTEGDLSHTFVINIMNSLAGGGVTALGEAGSFDSERNIVSMAHEGSTAMSLAGDLTRTQINPSGERGTFVGVPVKAMDEVTICSMVGNGGNYKIFVAKARTLEVTYDEWVAGGSKLIVNLQFDVPAKEALDRMMDAGMDHHLLLKEGDYTKEMKAFCDYMGFEVVTL